MGAKLFFSNTRADADLVSQIADRLQRSGAASSVLTDSMFEPGEAWAEQLRHALQDSDAVVVMLSESSSRSSMVMGEFGAALVLQKPIIGLRSTSTAFPFTTTASNIHMVDTADMSADDIAKSIEHSLAE